MTYCRWISEKCRLAMGMLVVLVALGATAALPGCNTMEGVGRDVEAAGDSIQDAAN